MTVQPTQSILIVDFGSQVTQLIARRVREAGVYCEIAPFNAAEEAFERLQPQRRDLLRRPGFGHRRGKPARAAGAVRQRPSAARHLLRPADAAPAARRQGRRLRPARVRPRVHRDRRAHRALFDGLWNVGEKHQVWMSHGDRVETLAPGFEVVARVRRRAVRDRHQRGGEALQPDVPPGGRAHARRRQAARQFRPARLRLRRRLDDGELQATPRSPTSASRSATGG